MNMVSTELTQASEPSTRLTLYEVRIYVYETSRFAVFIQSC